MSESQMISIVIHQAKLQAAERGVDYDTDFNTVERLKEQLDVAIKLLLDIKG